MCGRAVALRDLGRLQVSFYGVLAFQNSVGGYWENTRQLWKEAAKQPDQRSDVKARK